MGSDDLFHKRKKRKAAKLLRRKASIEPYDVVLIVCEGEKTEPNYFNEFKKFYRLNNANVRVLGRGVDPLSVVNHAIEVSKKEKEFDRVYCVFDRDRHTTYHAALERIRAVKLPSRMKIIGIPSVPCFEFWLLLHFEYTTKPFFALFGESICGEIINRLRRKYLPEYRKGDKGVFRKLQDRMNVAVKRARKIEEFHKTSGTDNPSTKMHILVEYLKNLKEI